MAFTIDFGNDDAEEKKKLSLRDGIRRFAPSKKVVTREKATQNVTTTVVANVTSTSPSPAVVRLPTNTNDFVDRKNEKPLMESRVTSTKRVVVDRENNIESGIVVMPRDGCDAKIGDTASEAGTYTIDQVSSCHSYHSYHPYYMERIYIFQLQAIV